MKLIKTLISSFFATVFCVAAVGLIYLWAWFAAEKDLGILIYMTPIVIISWVVLALVFYND